MPRGYNVTRTLPSLKGRRGAQPKPETGPDLYNGHKRIQETQGLLLIPRKRAQLQKRITFLQRKQTPNEYDKSYQASGEFAQRALQLRALQAKLKTLPSGPEYSRILSEVKTFRESWRGLVSADVEAFYDACKAMKYELTPSEKKLLLTDPAVFFSSPQNVPSSLRKQQFFPQFKITFVRCGWMGPYFARFRVPLWFSKLDLKSYLKSVYDVDTVHVRSLIRKGARTRSSRTPRSLGPRIQFTSKKEMFAQLVEPFEWPVPANEVDLEPSVMILFSPSSHLDFCVWTY